MFCRRCKGSLYECSCGAREPILYHAVKAKETTWNAMEAAGLAPKKPVLPWQSRATTGE